MPPRCWWMDWLGNEATGRRFPNPLARMVAKRLIRPLKEGKVGHKTTTARRTWLDDSENGTLSRKIYGMLVQGKGTTEIASELSIKIANARVLAHKLATQKRSAPNDIMRTTTRPPEHSRC